MLACVLVSSNVFAQDEAKKPQEGIPSTELAAILLSNDLEKYGYQNNFEGTIRVAFSLNHDNLIRYLNTLKDNALPFLNELMAGYNADYELIVKVKGNKFINFNTQNGSTTLFDCDKGEIYLTYPYAEVTIKYTAAEWEQTTAASTSEYKFLKDSVQEFVGYSCTKMISTTTYYGVQNSYSEMWVTNDIVFPKCYTDLAKAPQGCIMVANLKTMVNNIDSYTYCCVVEIDTSAVSNEAFILPKNYKMFTPKDNLKFGKKLNDAAKNKKTYTVGSKIPDTFWDF